MTYITEQNIGSTVLTETGETAVIFGHTKGTNQVCTLAVDGDLDNFLDDRKPEKVDIFYVGFPDGFVGRYLSTGKPVYLCYSPNITEVLHGVQHEKV